MLFRSQENIAYPSGLCAERTAIFAANANYPNANIVSIAIAAQDKNGFTKLPVSPCGACRQVLIESENRFKKNIVIYLYGEEYIIKIDNAKLLLPLTFKME